MRAALVVLALAARAAASTAPPIIDVGPLLGGSAAERQSVVRQIGDACTSVGFFYVVGHGVDAALQSRLDSASATFFAQPPAVKRRIDMARAGSRWRGYFAVGEELTSSIVDQKEGLYFAAELPDSDARPLHGPNLWPPEADAPGLRACVLDYMDALRTLAYTLLQAVGEAVELPIDFFAADFAEPTTLFRVFHYPPHDERWGADAQGVGEHTDYGYLTILRQDDSGGLQARALDGAWTDVPPVEGALIVNLGDALEHCTGGLLRATPHRVLQRAGATSGRLSFPFFFDPAFDAPMRSCRHLLPPALRALADERRRSAPGRWDGRDVSQYEGTYGDYLIAKVSKVFPELAQRTALHM